MTQVVTVKGYRELKRLATAAGKTASRELNAELREVAEPIRADAEGFAAAGIRRIGPNWSRMRVGVTTRVVYVAPRERGIKTRGVDGRRRPKFATLLEQRAMTPALRRNEPLIAARVNTLFDHLADRWNRD